ncbi:MAG: hypothetical protein AABW87_03130 [Nanoarchaeota archaeon]
MPQDLNYILSELNARVRALEGKYTQFGERLLVVNQNMIEEYKKMIKEIKALESEMRETKNDVFSLKENMRDISKEGSLFARKDEVKVLEKYINMWDPLKFITEEEAIKIIETKLKEIKDGIKKEKKGVKHAGRKRRTASRSRR